MHEKNPQTKFLSMQTYLTSGGCGGGENGEKMFKKIYPWTIIWWIGKLVDIIEKAHSLKRGKALLAFLQVFQL